MRAFGNTLGEGILECADGRSMSFEVGGDKLNYVYALAERKMQESNFPQSPELLARVEAAQLSALNLGSAMKRCSAGQIPIDSDGPGAAHGLPAIPIKAEQAR